MRLRCAENLRTMGDAEAVLSRASLFFRMPPMRCLLVRRIGQGWDQLPPSSFQPTNHMSQKHAAAGTAHQLAGHADRNCRLHFVPR